MVMQLEREVKATTKKVRSPYGRGWRWYHEARCSCGKKVGLLGVQSWLDPELPPTKVTCACGRVFTVVLRERGPLDMDSIAARYE